MQVLVSLGHLVGDFAQDDLVALHGMKQDVAIVLVEDLEHVLWQTADVNREIGPAPRLVPGLGKADRPSTSPPAFCASMMRPFV